MRLFLIRGEIPRKPGKRALQNAFSNWLKGVEGQVGASLVGKSILWRFPAGELSLWRLEGCTQEELLSVNEISLSVEMIQAKQERGEAQQGNTTWNYNGRNGRKRGKGWWT